MKDTEVIINNKEKLFDNKLERNESFTDEKEKIETKGLKLKKSTKERLNLLQSSFDDAESMILALLNQYEVFKIEGNEKFADRKGEIDRFNYLIESIKECFINSLEMATYIEDKCNDKIKKELKKKDRIISLLQDENNSLNKKIEERNFEFKDKIKELTETKESFTRVNLALTTVEKELSEKAKIIENLQIHISSLSDLSKENKSIKKENNELERQVKILENKLTENKIDSQKFEYLKLENERYLSEVFELRNEKNEYKLYANELNCKIQDILLDKSNEITKINNEKNQLLKTIEEKNKKDLTESNNIINKLKDELYELKLTLGNNIKTK